MQDDYRRNADLTTAVTEAEKRYAAANPLSAARARAAMTSMPGGNTRTVLHYDPFPLGLAGGAGCHVTDLDGHRYVDFLGEYTAGLYGHSHPQLMTAIRQALDAGVTLVGPNRHEAELAALMVARFPSVELVRFCNSGTEANLLAMATARMHTGRDALLVFEGGYHGSVFYFGQVKPPTNAPYPWVMARYNDLAGTRDLIAANASRLAAVVIEPMQGGGGGFAATAEFLTMLRTETARHGSLLIFDEVMTSRLSPGGLQQLHGIDPDLTAFGKYLGGGMSFGAFGGKRAIMRRYDPSAADAVSHAGTFNNNVLSMAAGVTGLRDVYTPAEANRLNRMGEDLKARLNALFARTAVPMQCLGVGSILVLHMTSDPLERPEDTWVTGEAAERQKALGKLLHLDLLEAGIYMARRGFLSLSLPMTPADIDTFIAAIDEFVTVRRTVLGGATARAPNHVAGG